MDFWKTQGNILHDNINISKRRKQVQQSKSNTSFFESGLGRDEILEIENFQLLSKAKPKLPKVSREHAVIVSAVTLRGDIISGGFAQKTLYPKSREGFKDIDVISSNPRESAYHIKRTLEEYGPNKKGRIVVSQGTLGKYTVSEVDTYGKRTLADVVPVKLYSQYAEKGSLPTRHIQGVSVLKEQALFSSKKAAALHSARQRKKALEDLRRLSSYGM